MHYRQGKLTPRAQELRRNATKEENHLWYDFLCSYPVRFRRQFVIDCFIVDFYCAGAKLAIELDGSQHYEDDALAYDRRRTEFLNARGIAVLRFTNTEIKRQFPAVCEMIDNTVKERMGLPHGPF